MQTIIEPFRIKSVELIRMSDRWQRETILKQPHYDLFLSNSY